MPSTGPPSNDQILASAVNFLAEGSDYVAAQLLLSCELEVGPRTEYESGFDTWQAFPLTLIAPRRAFDVLADQKNPTRALIHRALEAVMPVDAPIGHIDVRAQLVAVHPGWRADLGELARGQGVSNQGVEIPGSALPITKWMGLRFRSQGETRIAQALDRAGVFFLPNCMGRVTTDDGRRNKEPDFVVCEHGRWGILEVDGPIGHASAAADHSRDRVFRAHGAKIVERYPWQRCFDRADEVVAEFLRLLRAGA